MIRIRQQLGKYRIERRLGEGAFASVFQAFDTIEGVRVALKVPHPHLMTKEALDAFREEVRLSARLDHANILPLKNAAFIDGQFVIALPLGHKTLADRLRSRMSLEMAMDLIEQMLEAVAYAHRHKIIHCDVKPENLILTREGRIRLTDFGISKVAQRTVRASGSGTVGYVAPEQAMGRPSFRSDVFSLGLVIWRMLSGRLPEWPFEHPLPGYDRLRGRLRPELVGWLLKSIEVHPRDRFADANAMLGAYQRLLAQAPRGSAAPPRKKRRSAGAAPKSHWKTIRRKQFLRKFGAALETHFHCESCHGPVSEAMAACPWCGKRRKKHKGKVRFPLQCPRCERGMKLDWPYCPWCFGAGFEPASARAYSDTRYTERCHSASCRKPLMPYMRYCPWCRRKVRKKWKIPGSTDVCASCGWGVVAEFWEHCPWCAKGIKKG